MGDLSAFFVFLYPSYPRPFGHILVRCLDRQLQSDMAGMRKERLTESWFDL